MEIANSIRGLLAGVLVLSVGGAAPSQPGPRGADQGTTRASPIQLETKNGKIDGTIDLPAGAGPFPVVILIAGSGPTDRDGNQPRMKNDSLKQLGHGLAARGIAVLRYDRRGIGKSAAVQPKEEDLRFDMLVGDVVEWIKVLRKDKRFSRVGVVGHSEGSLVGMLAAKQGGADAFVALAGCGRPASEVLRWQLAKNLPRELKDRSDAIIDELAAGRTVADTPRELVSLFRPSVQPYLISYFKYDPAREIARLTIPVLIVQGTTDLQTPVDDAKLLVKARKDAQLSLIEGMNHVLKQAKSMEEQKAAYFDPTIPIEARLVEDVSAFLRKRLEKR